MSFLDDLIRKAAGKVGKVGAAVTGALNLPTAKSTGESIFASLQNYGGNKSGPIVWAKPAYASDGSSSGVTGTWTERDPNKSYTDQPFYKTLQQGVSFSSGSQPSTNQQSGNQNYSFGDPNNPDLSNPVKQTDYDNWLRQSQEESAQQARQSELDSILARLGLMRDVANQKISRAGEVKSNMLTSIGDQFSALRQSAQNKMGTALENLGQEEVGVKNEYGRAAGNARRAMESALARNRMLARAMNRLNSSFYDDRQAQTNETGVRTIADIGTEEARKLAGIGTRKTETKNWFEEQGLSLDNEEKDLKLKAEQEYNDKIDEAAFMERAYGIDALDEAKQAEITYQSKLDQIDKYIENKALRMAEIAATAGDKAGVINAFSAISPTLQATLSNRRALSSAQNLNLPTFTGVTTSTQTPDYMAFMQQNPESDQAERLRRIFGYAYA